MNPQLSALMQLLSSSSGLGSIGSLSGLNAPSIFGGDQGSQGSSQPQQQPQTYGSSGVTPDNSDIMNALRGPSPVNANPNYASTVSRFFNQSPLGGIQAYQGSNPLSPGAAGNNAARGGMGHSSFLPTDFSSSMNRWTSP